MPKQQIRRGAVASAVPMHPSSPKFKKNVEKCGEASPVLGIACSESTRHPLIWGIVGLEGGSVQLETQRVTALWLFSRGYPFESDGQMIH